MITKDIKIPDWGWGKHENKKVINGKDNLLWETCAIEDATNFIYSPDLRVVVTEVHIYYIVEIADNYIKGYYLHNGNKRKDKYQIAKGVSTNIWTPIRPVSLEAPTREDIIKHLEL